MRRFVFSVFVLSLPLWVMIRAVHPATSWASPARAFSGRGPDSAESSALAGYSADAARAEHDWETKFRALPSPENMRSYMQRISARPHHVGTEYDRANAEWILSLFRQWGWDAHIENFDVLFPTPKERLVQIVPAGPEQAVKQLSAISTPISDCHHESAPFFARASPKTVPIATTKLGSAIGVLRLAFAKPGELSVSA